jgi:hypothetical protein
MRKISVGRDSNLHQDRVIREKIRPNQEVLVSALK